MGRKPAEFRAPGMRPSPRIGGGGAIPTEPTMAFDSRLTVEGARPSEAAICRIESFLAMPREISSRSANVRASGRPEALLHHPDRGSQYTSEPFQRLLADHGVTCSMSRAGNVWDNAAMERFFSSLKTERTASKMHRTRDQAKAEVFDDIERFYNPARRHSTWGYLSPMEFEGQAK